LEVFGTDRGVSGSAKADSNSAGVYGNSASTVAAQPGGDGVFGTGDRCGVHGTATAIGGGNPGVWGQNDFTGNGVQGTSAAGDGVQGYGGGTGRGVYGQGGSGGGNGVQGYAGSASAVGVFAVNVFGGIGLFGASDVAGGTGVKGEGAAVGVAAVATSATGLGLDVHGPAKFSRSGVVTISGTKAKPRSSAVVSVPGRPLRAHSLILATPQTYLSGLSVAATVPHSTTFRIHLTRAVHTKVKVAWFIVD
jgi:hypothetical protein